jgi:hypothetical protein
MVVPRAVASTATARAAARRLRESLNVGSSRWMGGRRLNARAALLKICQSNDRD